MDFIEKNIACFGVKMGKIEKIRSHHNCFCESKYGKSIVVVGGAAEIEGLLLRAVVEIF